MLPKLTVSGYRGIWGDTLNPAIARKYFEGFAQFLKVRYSSKIIIARDTRSSGKELSEIATDVFTSIGIDIIDIGITPTPTVLYLVRKYGYDGAIMITASHNPIEYNGLKFINSSGLFTNEEEVREINLYLNNDLDTTEMVGEYIEDTKLPFEHVQHILDNIDVEIIKSKKIKVVLDTINGTGTITTPTLLEKLGCEVTIINGVPDGNFAHIPEPLPQNLSQLGEKVREVGADIGFAQDPDADRLVVCDENGEIIFEEYSLSLAILSVLEKEKGSITINMSTSNTNTDIAKAFDCKTFRTKVGEANVVNGIIENNSVIGGEGSGGIIYPKINTARDSLVGIAIILELLAHSNKKVSQLVGELPKYEMHKEKISFNGDLTNLYREIKNTFTDGLVNELDGLRIDFPDSSWLHVRPSNTEPIVRLIVEAKTKERIVEILGVVKNITLK